MHSQFYIVSLPWSFDLFIYFLQSLVDCDLVLLNRDHSALEAIRYVCTGYFLCIVIESYVACLAIKLLVCQLKVIR